MRKAYLIGAVVVVVAVVALAVAAAVWSGNRASPGALKHETARWAVIEDVNGDRMAVETMSNETWSVLVELKQNGSRVWVGSLVETYSNDWGFRFDPRNLTVAWVVDEDVQATVKYVSASFGNWVGRWAFFSVRVVEVHSPENSS